MLYARQKPNPSTLIETVETDLCPDGFYPTTNEEVASYVSEQLAAGWTPSPIPATPTQPQVPPSVTPIQIRKALSAAGLRAAFEAAVANGSQDLKDDWEFSLAFHRTNPLINQMATGLGLSADQVDALFIAAATQTT